MSNTQSVTAAAWHLARCHCRPPSQADSQHRISTAWLSDHLDLLIASALTQHARRLCHACTPRPPASGHWTISERAPTHTRHVRIQGQLPCAVPTGVAQHLRQQATPHSQRLLAQPTAAALAFRPHPCRCCCSDSSRMRRKPRPPVSTPRDPFPTLPPTLCTRHMRGSTHSLANTPK